MSTQSIRLADLTPEQLAKLQARLQGAGTRRAPAPAVVPRADRGTELPLSFEQERLWFLEQYAPGTATYNVPFALEIRGRLDAAALERALVEVASRHEALRTVFVTGAAGGPVQRVLPPGGLRLARMDLSAVPPHARGDEAWRRATDEVRRPFDLANGPVFRATLLTLAPDEHLLVTVVHHIACDAYSIGVLASELGVLYRAFSAGRPSPLPELPVQYPDFAAWQRDRFAGAALEGQLAYWRARLAGAPARVELPTDRPRPAVQDPRGGQLPLALGAETVRPLRRLAQAEGATLFMVAVAALTAVLGRWSGQDDVVVGTPITNRTRPELEGLIGFFANTLVLRTDLSGDPGFRVLLGRVRETTLDAYANPDIPFEKLVEALQPERSLSHTPFFQAMLMLQNNAREAMDLGSIAAEPVPVRSGTTLFDLTLYLAEDGDALTGTLEYRAELFDAATVGRMLDHFGALLRAVAADPDLRLSEVELLDADERERLVAWNDTARPLPAERRVHRLIGAQARRTPDAAAVVFAGDTVTFAELDARANRLARHLVRLGAGPEARVGICLERSAEMVVAMLAVLRAGAAYLPLDPSYPAERLAYMLADSGAPLLVTQDALRGLLPADGVRVVSMDADADAIAAESADAPDDRADAENAAYVIYTSGSTGRPKGVQVTHANAAAFFAGMDERVGGPVPGTWLAVTRISFDIHVLELLWTLARGFRVVVQPEPDRAREGEGIAEQIRRHAVTHLQCTPSLAAMLVQESGLESLAPLRRLFLGGEALPAELAARIRTVLPDGLVNLYGPTETTVWSTTHAVETDGAVPIGRPIANTRVHVLDARLRPGPAIVAGELCIAGAGVTRGYLRRPGLTAERFVPDPFSPAPGARMYRTGDRARRRPDGTLEYLGRMDQQVKIRGHRIEPGEVESVLRRQPGVRACAVVARGDAGAPRLVAYVAGAADLDALRSHLRQGLPEYMVPAAFVSVDHLPLTPSGKLDRRALPAPPETGEAPYVAPRTPVEEAVAGIWAEVLRVERVGVHDEFFALGGHSLLVMRVASRVRDVLAVDLPLRALFEAPALGPFAARVEAERRAGGVSLPPVAAGPRPARVPLSYAQERMWYVDQLEPGSPLFTVPFVLRLSGTLDADALGRALDEVVRRHEVLRTTLVAVDGSPVQVVAPAGPVPLPREDLSALPEEARLPEARRRAAAEAAAPFSLSAGPLLRARLLRLDPAEHVLLLTLHHAVTDGWSMPLLQRELAVLYAAFAEGRPSPLPEPALQYADYALWQRAHLAGVLEEQLAYWTAAMAGAPALLELPADRPRPPVQSHRGESVGVALPAELSGRLRALARAEGATLFMTLLAAFDLLLSRWSGQTDVVVGTSIAGRTRAELEGLVGLFFNTVVLRTDVSGDPSFRALLHRVRETTLGAYDHQELPFEKLVEALQPARTLRYTPLFQVLFELNGASPEAQAEGLAVRPEAVEAGTAKYDLTLTLGDAPEGIAGRLEFNTDLFDRATAERLAGAYAVLLHAVAADPSRPVSSYPLVTPAQRHELLHAWNPAPAPLPAEPLVHRLFEAQADRTPDARALEWEGGWMSFREMDARANQLANHLRARGVDREVRVGILTHRTPEMMIALFAVMKAGGAYVPLDPAHPADRIGYTLRDSGARVLLTESGLADRASGFAGQVVHVDRWDAVAHESAARPATDVGPENLAYVYYTSGSTGRPKGVLMHHRGVANYVEWGCRYYGAASGTGAPVFSSIAVDLTVTNFLPLFAGRRVVLVPEGPGVDALAALLRTRPGFSLIKITPTHLSLLTPLLSPDEARSAASTLVVGADDLRAEPTLFWQREAPGVRLLNEYGPTETVVGCAIYDVSAGAPESGPVSIGRTIDNLTWYVLDGRMEPVPAGVPGELYIGGAGVARGYGGRAALTAEKFVPDPFTGDAGARMYRTGDRARWLAGGQMQFLGRTDFQVKIRGYRVETGEVESVLMAHPGVARALALVREDTPGDPRLVAYVVPPQGAPAPEVAELRARVRERLPEYMMPGAFVFLTEADVPASGKISPAQLPAPLPASRDATAAQAPRTPTEEIVAAVWADVLGTRAVGTHEDFFELGGHSLLATRVATRIREAFGVDFPLRAFFDDPTVAGAAALLDDRRGGAHAGLPPLEAVARPGEWLPLSFAQQRLWLVHQMGTESRVYNQAVGFRLRGRLDAAALARALAEVVRRHAVFRTRFVERDGVPGQVIDPPRPVPVPLVDLRGAEDREPVLADLVRRQVDALFDLHAGPVLRVLLVRLADDEHALVVTMHHITSDGWSSAILYRELTALYGAFASGHPSPLPEPPVQYADYAVWQRGWLTPARAEEQLSFWRARLQGAPRLGLATDRAGDPSDTDGATHLFQLPAALSEGVRGLSRSLGATPFMTLLAAFNVLLRWQGGGDDVVVGTDVANRNLRAETEGLVGFFVNQLVLRTSLDGNPEFAALVARVREVALGAYDHQDVPFDRVVEVLRPRRGAGETPFFRVKFVLQNAPQARAAELPGLALEPLDTGRSAAQLDVLLAMHDDGERMAGWFEYRTSLFSPELIGRWGRRLQAVLEAAVEDPARDLDALEALLVDAESREAQAVQAALKEKRRTRFAR